MSQYAKTASEVVLQLVKLLKGLRIHSGDMIEPW